MRHGSRGEEAGYTIIELMVVVVLVGILASIAIPRYFYNAREARSIQCASNRAAIERSAFNFIETRNIPLGDPAPVLAALVDSGYFNIIPACASGGVYYWLHSHVPDDGFPGIGCSVHFAP